MVASKNFDFLLVEVSEALGVFPGTEKGGACTLSDVRIESGPISHLFCPKSHLFCPKLALG